MQYIPEILAESLTKSESTIVQLSLPTARNPKIKDIEDLVILTQKISQTANIRLGLRPRGQQEEEILLLTLEKDVNKFPNLTGAEILKALEMGIDGEFDAYGDIFFSSASFVKWVRAYIELRKKPVMAKYAQLNHQLKEPEIVPTEKEQRALIATTVNMYADQRRKDPTHRVMGASALYVTLDQFGIYKMSLEDKIVIRDEITAMNPGCTAEEIKALCQTTAYNRFISELVDFDMKLDAECNVVDIEPE